MNKIQRFTLSFVVAAFPLSARAADQLSAKDKAFVMHAGHAGHAEVAAGKLAATKTSNADVKKFAEQMVTDHSAAGEELSRIAQSKGVTVPTEPDATQKAMAKRLEAANAGDFDKLYVAQAGVADHKAAVDLFTDEAAHGSDPDLKAFAEKTLPTIKHHYEMAQELSRNQGRR